MGAVRKEAMARRKARQAEREKRLAVRAERARLYSGEVSTKPTAKPSDQTDDRSALIELANEAGVKIDGRWSDERLQEEIEKATEGGSDD